MVFGPARPPNCSKDQGTLRKFVGRIIRLIPFTAVDWPRRGKVGCRQAGNIGKRRLPDELLKVIP